MKGKLFILFLFTTLPFFSCKKNNPASPEGAIPVSTVNFNIVLNIDITHHQWGVPTIPVYIKLNTKQWPGKDTSLYDLKTVTDHYGSVILNNFGPGDFVIYSAGYDSIWGGFVLGYNTWTITRDDANSIVYSNVVVSEKF